MDYLQTSPDDSPATDMLRKDALFSDAENDYDYVAYFPVEYRYPMTERKRKGTLKRKKNETKPQNKRKIKQEPIRRMKSKFRETRRRQTALTRGSTESVHFCPVHNSEVLQRKLTAQISGGLWEYYRCPVDHCFVCCGVDHVERYVDSAKRQLHEFYVSKESSPMLCHCGRPSIMKQSHSKKNPERMFLTCSRRCCEFFQWTDEKPKGVDRAWSKEGRSRSKREGYPRPQKLYKLTKK